MIRFELLSAEALKPYEDSLRELETKFHYPLFHGESFHIRHGSPYSQFFERQGKPYFAIALVGERVVAILTGVHKKISVNGRPRNALYLADLKVDPQYQGKALSTRLFISILRKWIFRNVFWRTQTYYFAAMRGKKGDVTASARGASPLKLFQPVGNLLIYFADPKKLSKIKTQTDLNESAITQTQLSAVADKGSLVSLIGCKDLILKSSGKPLSITHIGNSTSIGYNFLEGLCLSAKKASEKFEVLCFGIDSNRTSMIQHLEEEGFHPAGQAGIYMFSWRSMPKGHSVFHMATHEI